MPDTLHISARGAQVVGCAITTVAIATFIVALRFITRSKLLKFVGREDWCIGIALLFSLGNTAGMITQTEFALGHHISDLSQRQIILFLKTCYFTIIAYNISLTTAKISILLLYFRLFSTKTMTIICYVHMVIVVLSGIWTVGGTIFACAPIAAYWDKSLGGHCLPDFTIWFLNASINIVIDLCIFILPLPVIRTLILPTRQKIGLYFVFMIGFCVCMISISRLYSLHIAVESRDPTWDNVGIANWSCVELNMAIICPSLTTLKPLVARIFPNLVTIASSQQNGKINSGDTHSNGFLKNFGVSKDALVQVSLPTTRDQSDADTSNGSETFDLVQLEGGLIRVSPKAISVEDNRKPDNDSGKS